MAIEEQFVYDWIETHAVEKYEESKKYSDGFVISFSDFYEEYKRWLDRNGMKSRFLGEQQLAMKLRNKLIPAHRAKIDGKTFWDFRSWDYLYKFYCEKVLYEDPGWNDEEISLETKEQYKDVLVWDEVDRDDDFDGSISLSAKEKFKKIMLRSKRPH
ncbi:MAG TPA: hypothetical protein EYO59_00970 [Chromatiaceae bacterium]|nr:hypothetical protein [Chromatiaceae bacterium]